MSGSRVVLAGDPLAAVVHGIGRIHDLQGAPSVVIGGLAVLCRLTTPYRATTDLDVVDRLRGPIPTLQLLRGAPDAAPVEPSAVQLPTPYGAVKVDVLEVQDIELDDPATDVGDRLHATSHAWAHDTATPLTIEVRATTGTSVEAPTPVATPGPLVAMKVQAVMNRSAAKQGTDLLDVVRLVNDPVCRPEVLAQLGAADDQLARDVAQHSDLWFDRERRRSLRWIRATGVGADVVEDDLVFVAEMFGAATARQMTICSPSGGG